MNLTYSFYNCSNKITDEVFNELYDANLSFFKEDELREDKEIKELLNNDTFNILVVRDNDNLIASLLFHNLEEFIFLENLLVIESYRQKGIGSLILTKMKDFNKPIILEIEPLDNDIAMKRYNFYKKNGFVLNDIDYTMPKLRVTSSPVKLLLLSYPTSFINPEKIKDSIYSNVYFGKEFY